MIEVGTEKAYDIQETAKLLNLSAQTVRTYVKTGKLVAQKVGARYYIAEVNLQKFLRGEV